MLDRREAIASGGWRHRGIGKQLREIVRNRDPRSGLRNWLAVEGQGALNWQALMSPANALPLNDQSAPPG